MSATAPLQTASGAALDELLDEICLTLQITPTQFELAEQHYRAVGEWLASAESALHTLKPDIYPQGSMALRTTVKPREREEYDLDLVLEVSPSGPNAMQLYGLVEARLRQHKEYRDRVERKRRCLRLNYAHDFHLDILPARHDVTRGGTCIEVPDRGLGSWKPSNPKGYAGWFEGLCESGAAARAMRKQAPLPDQLPEELTRPLRRAVQLLKRRRDNFFETDTVSPRSIILTTLAGQLYQGEESVLGALQGIVARMEGAINHSAPRRLEVYNPTNRSERLSEQWDDPRAYEAFVKFVRQLNRDAEALSGMVGLAQVGEALDEMFGEGLGSTAVRAYTKRIANAKEEGALRFTASGLAVGVADAHRSPRHTFHHGEA
jgi:hypothetical protein